LSRAREWAHFFFTNFFSKCKIVRPSTACDSRPAKGGKTCRLEVKIRKKKVEPFPAPKNKKILAFHWAKPNRAANEGKFSKKMVTFRKVSFWGLKFIKFFKFWPFPGRNLAIKGLNGGKIDKFLNRAREWAHFFFTNFFFKMQNY